RPLVAPPALMAAAPPATSAIPSAAPTPTASPSPSGLALLEPQAGQQVACPAQGPCDVTVRGTLDVPLPPDGRVVLWWHPAAGGTIWFAQTIDALQQEGGDHWMARVHIGNVSYTPRDGDTFDLAATVTDHETLQRLALRAQLAFSLRPEGRPVTVVSGLQIHTS
ncbi:MAG: hypothetical protein JOY51_02100, partial [Nevskia sp.]|nr:hypothetical protein [Nevskia sp.]